MTCVLCVSEDQYHIELLQTVLNRAGFGTLGALNSPKALAILRDQQIDLILDDYRRLERTDFDLLLAKNADPTLRDIPLVVMENRLGLQRRSHEKLRTHGLDVDEAFQRILPQPLPPKLIIKAATDLTGHTPGGKVQHLLT
jgi:CheY-like chemotaxis protein